MGKRSNRLSETLYATQAENAELVIRTESADTIMAQGNSHKDAEYMTAFVTFCSKKS